MSSPSFNFSASTTAAGSRIARLLPHLKKAPVHHVMHRGLIKTLIVPSGGQRATTDCLPRPVAIVSLIDGLEAGLGLKVTFGDGGRTRLELERTAE